MARWPNKARRAAWTTTNELLYKVEPSERSRPQGANVCGFVLALRIEVARTLPSRAAFARLVRIEADASDERANRAYRLHHTFSAVAPRLFPRQAEPAKPIGRGRNVPEHDLAVSSRIETGS